MRFDPTIQICLPLELFFFLSSSFGLFMAGIAETLRWKSQESNITHGPQALSHPLLTLSGWRIWGASVSITNHIS